MSLNNTVYKIITGRLTYIVVYILLLVTLPITYIYTPKLFVQISKDAPTSRSFPYRQFVVLMTTVSLLMTIQTWFDSSFYPQIQTTLREYVLEYLRTTTNEYTSVEQRYILDLPENLESIIRIMNEKIIPYMLLLAVVFIQFVQIDSVLALTSTSALLILLNSVRSSLSDYTALERTKKEAIDVWKETIGEHDDNIEVYHTNSIKSHANLFGALSAGFVFVFSMSIVYAYYMYSIKKMSRVNVIRVTTLSIMCLSTYKAYLSSVPSLSVHVDAYKYAEQLMN